MKKKKIELGNIPEHRWALAGYPQGFQEYVLENVTVMQVATLAARIYAGRRDWPGDQPGDRPEDWRYWIEKAIALMFEAWKAAYNPE